jgi:hypothetical protein
MTSNNSNRSTAATYELVASREAQFSIKSFMSTMISFMFHPEHLCRRISYVEVFSMDGQLLTESGVTQMDFDKGKHNDHRSVKFLVTHRSSRSRSALI